MEYMSSSNTCWNPPTMRSDGNPLAAEGGHASRMLFRPGKMTGRISYELKVRSSWVFGTLLKGTLGSFLNT